MPELDDAALERRLRGVLQEHLGALPLDLTVDALDRRREAKGVARRSGRGRGMTLLAAAALLLVGGALAAGSGLLRLPTVVPPVPAPSVDRGRHGIARRDVPEPERIGGTIRKSRHERVRGSAGRPERADRSTGLDPGEPEGGLARAGPPRARWRRERPTDAPHLPRSHGRQRIQCIAPCVDIRWVMADTSEVRLKLVSKPPPWSCRKRAASGDTSSGSRMAS